MNLRELPRRNGELLGYIPLGTRMKVTGPPVGEYTSIRIADHEVQQPAPEQTPPLPDPDPKPLGQVRIDLHAAADPDISDEEIVEFGLFRPNIIKVLSFHDPVALRELAQNHPDAKWVARAFLDFGGRSISPQKFFNDTISDMKRTMDILHDRDVVIELHNEPNIMPEGLESAWTNGTDFATWWLRLLHLYRYIFPDQRFIYPGLSPGAEVYRLKQDHIRFLEASRAAVNAANGLGIHLYWSVHTPMDQALKCLDNTTSRFRNTPIWVTEASNNKGGTTASDKAYQYLSFWKELQKRPIVEGITYFVASARNPDFSEEVFVGNNNDPIVKFDEVIRCSTILRIHYTFIQNSYKKNGLSLIGSKFLGSQFFGSQFLLLLSQLIHFSVEGANLFTQILNILRSGDIRTSQDSSTGLFKRFIGFRSKILDLPLSCLKLRIQIITLLI